MRGIRGRRLLRTAVATAGAIGLWLGMVPAPQARWSTASTLSLAGAAADVRPSSARDPPMASGPQYENGGWCEAARFFYKDGSLGPVMMRGAVAPDWPGVGIDRLGTAVVAWAAPDGRVVARRVTPGHVSALKVIMPAVTGI